MTTLREAAQQALEALEDIGGEWGFTSQRTLPKPWKQSPPSAPRWQSKEQHMTREQYLDLLILLSSLESLILAHKVPVPDSMFDLLVEGVELLRQEVLK